MSKFQITTIILWLILSFSWMPKSFAISPSGEDTVNLYLVEESDLNFKSFEVNISEAGYYYVEFWLIPAQYSDGTYTRFSVYANDDFIGYINPSKGNWQAIRIDKNETINLKRGVNVIKIGVPSPEIPAVETLRIARTDVDAVLSSRAYDTFYDKASTETLYVIPQEAQLGEYTNEVIQSSSAPDVSLKHFSDVPLLYTFHILFNFSFDQEVCISTSGLSEHDVDIIYIGKKQITSGGELVTNSTYISGNANTQFIASGNINDQIFSTSSNIRIKQAIAYDLAPSEELQGLNWKSISTQIQGKRDYTTTKTIKIPKTGVYLIRLRHRESGKTGKASLVVNNKYKYTDVPISFIWVPCELAANGNEYGTFAKSSDSEVDDPMLFIHGAAADRVVGFCDDASRWMQVVHELSAYDSHILQQYNVRTSGISVSNYSSSMPESSCYIITGLDESVFDPGPGWNLKPKWNEASEQSGYDYNLKGVDISDMLEQNGIAGITTQFQIQDVTVQDLSGSIIRSVKRPSPDMSISEILMNLVKPGVYIISIKTVNGIVSKKVFFE